MSKLLVLLKKDGRALVNTGRVLRRQSRFKTVFIALFGAGMLLGLFALFLEGFEFLASLGGVGFLVTRRLFSLFFLGLSVMLMLSSVLTSYATVFRSREVPFLLVQPFSASDIVGYTFVGSTVLGSWALLLIIIPFAAAYGWHEGMGVTFCLWTAVYSIPLLVLCSGIGSLVSFLFARWIPLRRRGLALALIVPAGLFAAWVLRTSDRSASPSVFMLSGIVPALRLASLPFLPSWWTGEGIMACTRGRPWRAFMLWFVLVSNAALVCLIVMETGTRTFITAFQNLKGAGTRGNRTPVLLQPLEQALRILPRPNRGMFIKDVRDFLRDPVQWSQVLVFFGLLALYFAGIGSFQYQRLPREWRHLIAFLNVFSVAAVQCSLASRFVFPQLSLEGQAFWIVGLSPVGPRRILVTKFLSALLGMLAVSVPIMMLSTSMLEVDVRVTRTALALTAAISCGLCGLAVGLGAVFIDLKQSNPLAIVSGFGGTVNLALSLGFMLACILPFGLAFHLLQKGVIASVHAPHALTLAALWLTGLTLLTTLLPLWLGKRCLASMQ